MPAAKARETGADAREARGDGMRQLVDDRLEALDAAPPRRRRAAARACAGRPRGGRRASPGRAGRSRPRAPRPRSPKPCSSAVVGGCAPSRGGAHQTTRCGASGSMPRRRARPASAGPPMPLARSSNRSLMRLRSASRSVSCRRLSPTAVWLASEFASSRSCSLARRPSASRATRKPSTSSPATSGATSAERIAGAPQSVPASTEVRLAPGAPPRRSSMPRSGSETTSGPSTSPPAAARRRSESPLASTR